MPLSEQALSQMFLPAAWDGMARAREANLRFAYYTSAETATSLLKNSQMWLRNARLMNDFSEVQHGIDCYQVALRGPAGDQLLDIVDEIHPGIAAETLAWLDHHSHLITQGTYVVCVSEHDESEDKLGRLSMWRAYGGKAGVALVFSTDALINERNQLGALAGPVVYGDIHRIENELRRVAENAIANLDQLRETDRESIRRSLIKLLLIGCLYTKSPGFQEEREWRVISCPTLLPANNLIPSVESIGGLPQPVLKIPLQDGPNVTGLAIPQILERIIIGPCANPSLVRQAMLMTLEQFGHSREGLEVFCSNIPLRI